MMRNLNHFAVITLIVMLMGCKKDETRKVTPEPVTLPTITDFNPKAAMAGESVMITGANFGSDTNQVSVTFGSETSVKPKSVSNTEMAVKVPTGAQSGKIQVTVNGKSVTTAASFSLTETPAPAITITGFTPLTAASGDSVIITDIGPNALL